MGDMDVAARNILLAVPVAKESKGGTELGGSFGENRGGSFGEKAIDAGDTDAVARACRLSDFGSGIGDCNLRIRVKTCKNDVFPEAEALTGNLGFLEDGDLRILGKCTGDH